MLQQQLWQQQKNIGCQFCDPKTEIGKVTEFHKKKSKRLDVIEEKLMGGANLAPPLANRVKEALRHKPKPIKHDQICFPIS